MLVNTAKRWNRIVSFVALWAVLAASPVLGQSGTGSSQPASAGTSKADSSSSPSTAQSAPAAPSETKAASHGPKQQDGVSNDRLFWTLPNFLTVENAQQIPPLTAKQKFNVVVRTSLDPVEYPYVGFLAGISQAQNSEPGYGQGGVGYAKRFGSYFADNTIENFMTGAILPSVLHQDPRYFQLGQGTFKHRLGYAISRIFVTRSDSGKTQFNASEIVGSGAAAAIGTYSYHPAADRTVGNAISVWGSAVGWDTVAIGVKEFWPDIRRKVQNRHHDQAAAGKQDTSAKNR